MTTIRFARILGILACLTTAAGVTRAPAAAVSASDARTLSGRVTEPSGGPVAQATVRLVELKRTATSDNDGKYSITQIPPGTYTVSVRVIGYAPQVRRVTVGGADVTLDVTLKPSVIELPAVQVSATAEATSALNSPQPVAMVSEEDLAKVRPTNLGEALADIAGVRNNSSGEAAGKPVIRGLTNNRVLVLDNGQRLEHNQWGDDHFSSVEPAASYRNDRLNLTDSDSTATGRAGTDDHRGHLDLSIPVGSSRLDWGVGYERNQRHEWADATSTSEAFGMRQKSYTTEARLHHASLGPFSGLVGFSGEYTTDANFGSEFLEPDSKAADAAVYVFEQTDVGRWSLSFGGRYDYRHLDVDANADLGNPAAKRHWSSVTGNLGVLYHVTEPVALVLNVGRGFRSPSTFDLFANGPHEATQTFERGNPSLKTETSLNTDVAVRIQTASAAAELGGFVNLIKNFIYTVPANQIDPSSALQIYDVTQGDAVLRGFEGQLQYHPTTYLHLEGPADYVYGQNTTAAEPLPTMPPFAATYTARLDGTSSGALSSPYFSVGGETNARQTRMDPAEATFYADAFGGLGCHSKSYTLVNLATGFSLPTSGGRRVQSDSRLTS